MFNEFQEVFHGSPNNKITQFDINKIGTHGSQYGPGVYTASNPSEAEGYMREFGYKEPHMYKVQIPSDKYLLNHTKSFSEQTPYVQDKLKSLRNLASGNNDILKNIKWNNYLKNTKNSDELLSLLYTLEDKYGKSGKSLEAWLDKVGIPGNIHKGKYAGFNKVIFNPINTKIIKQLYSIGADPFTIIPEMLKLQGAYPYSQKEYKQILNDMGIDYNNGQIQI